MKKINILVAVFLFFAFCFNANADKKGKTGSSATVSNATAVPYTPAGNIAATNVGAALNELDSEKAGLSTANTFTNNATFQSEVIISAGRLKIPLGRVGYADTTGTLISIAAISDGITNQERIDVPSTVYQDNCFNNGGLNNGNLALNCAGPTKWAFVTATISATPATDNDQFVFTIKRGYSALTNCSFFHQLSGTQTISYSCLVEAYNNGVSLAAFVGNMTSTDDITIKSLNLQVIVF